MRMKRIFLAFVAATIAVIAAAQNERPTNWFIGAEGGFNVGFDGKDYISRVESHSGNGTAFDVYFGKFFNNSTTLLDSGRAIKAYQSLTSMLITVS